MNEAETRAELIDPALRAAGWGVVADSRVRRETICPGRIEGAGRRGKPEIADYVLTFRNHKLAVIEAKARDKARHRRRRAGQGLCREAAGALRLFHQRPAHLPDRHGDRRRRAMSSAIRRRTNSGPRCSQTPNEWRDRFAAVPFEEQGGTWQTRYYQHNAIENALEAIAAGKQRILLTLATGTGKTAIAFQIAWTLFQSRWNLSRKPSGGRASCSSPTATSWPIRPTTPSRPFPRTRWRASSRTKSARKAACRRTPASSSRSSRPS